MSNSSLKLWDFYFSDFTFELPFINNENLGFWRHYNCLLLYQCMCLKITIPILLILIITKYTWHFFAVLFNLKIYYIRNV